jgi:hypothetical protein
MSIAGATNSTLSFAALKTTDSATYSVLAYNLAGKASSQNTVLTVVAASVAPSFTLHPVSSATVLEGSAFTLTSAATGTPTPTYHWRKNGVAITGATNSTLSLAALQTSDTATYDVVATNVAGQVSSQHSTLTVVAKPLNTAPIFTTHPISQTVAAAANVTFTVATSGTPAPFYQWFRNGVAIAGATTTSYTLSNVNSTHAGTYTVVAKNIAGSAMSQGAVLTVIAK